MVEINVIGSWEYRPQTLDSIAEAGVQCLRAMPNVPAGVWVTPRKVGDSYINEPVAIDSVEELRGRIKQATVDSLGGEPVKPGYDVVAYRETPEGSYAVQCRLRAGFEGPRGVRNHILVRLKFADGDSVETGRLVKDYMAALVQAWHPTALSAHTYEFMKSQGWAGRPKQISIGWDTYLADSVDFDESAVDDDVSVVHADGGRYLTLDGTPAHPDMEQAQSIRRALGYR